MPGNKDDVENSVAEEADDAEARTSSSTPQPYKTGDQGKTTVQLRRSTRDRLAALKAPGLTYDDVVNLVLDNFPEDEFHRLFEEWQAEAASQLLDDSSMVEANVSKDEP